MNPDKPTLLGYLTGGKYQQSSEIPEVKPYLTPALEFATGATHRPEGQSGSLVDAAMATPVIGQVGRIIRGGKSAANFAKASRWIPRKLTTIGPRGNVRDVVSVEMTRDGKNFMQPFYKSSGTSQRSADMVKRGELAERAGTWEPFLGRTEKGGFYKMGSNTGRYSKEMKPGWWVKGWREGADDYRIAQSKRGVKDIDARMGPMKEVSDEIARLDKLGYFQSAGSVKGATQKPVNKWLEGYGFNRGRSESPFR